MLQLNVATELKSHDSIFYSFPHGGNIQLQTEGGIPPYRYQWSNGSGSTGISDLSEGSYRVTITDSIGCILKKEFAIVNIPDQQDQLRVFPNPSFEQQSFTVQIASSKEDDGVLMVRDILGRKLLSQNIHLFNGVNQIHLINSLPQGIFVISYAGNKLVVKPVKFEVLN